MEPVQPVALLAGVDRRELAAVFLGGCVGGLLRYGLAEAFHASSAWPWPTFIANVIGSFLLGYFATRLQERLPLSAYRRPFLGTGVCGALTTFSTVQLELLHMLDRDDLLLAGAYAGASLVCGFAALLLATKLVRRARVMT